MTIKIPYRINWAGAYLDCIDEPVVTSTIDKYITIESKQRVDNRLSVFSIEFNRIYEVDLRPRLNRMYSWTDYIDGCIAAFARHDFNLRVGCDMIVRNDLPSGIGVSGSAAFIVAILKTICYWNDLEVSDDVIAHLGYWVEHDYLQIPCGRMDFKAVLHIPGIWKLDTSSNSLGLDKKISDSHFVGLLVYKEQHEHLTDEKFLNNVARIKNTKYHFGHDSSVGEYINFEGNIVSCINYQAQQDNLTEDQLGMFLNQSSLNLKVNLLGQEYHLSDIEGVYGEKLVGSGLKGARFLLINPDYEESIREQFKDFNIVKCNL